MNLRVVKLAGCLLALLALPTEAQDISIWQKPTTVYKIPVPASGVTWTVKWTGDGNITYQGVSADKIRQDGQQAVLTLPAGFKTLTLNVPPTVADVHVFEGAVAPTVTPAVASLVKGGSFKLVKNWDFGTNDLIKGTKELDAEFDYHDQFGTVANGTHYGAVIVATSNTTSIGVNAFSTPVYGRQPVEYASAPVRTFTPSTMLAHVRPLTSTQTTIGPAYKHDAGCGSLVSKFTLPKGGQKLGKDLLWETRVRMVNPVDGYWFALWTAGQTWHKGPEMDVVESYSDTPESGLKDGKAFHVNSVGGQDSVDYSNWWRGMEKSGMPLDSQKLTNWHTFSWVYLRDDSYVVYIDGKEFQRGVLHWTDTFDAKNPVDTNLYFLFDFSWGHTDIWPINEAVNTLKADRIVMSYEIDYSRVYLRD